jgi:hypothetical protein
MTKAATTKLKKGPETAPWAPLAPGIHAARIDVCAGDRYHVHTLAGERVEARLGDDVEKDFADACVREHRTVLVTPGKDGVAVILGALQTSHGTVEDDQGTIRSRGKHVEIEADERLTLRVGTSALMLDKSGTVKLIGQKITINVADLVRILSAACELP